MEFTFFARSPVTYSPPHYAKAPEYKNVLSSCDEVVILVPQVEYLQAFSLFYFPGTLIPWIFSVIFRHYRARHLAALATGQGPSVGKLTLV